MVPYLLLLSIPCLLAIFHPRKINSILFYVVLLVFVFFVGFRYQIGPDWNSYEYTHLSLLGQDIIVALLHSEPLSYALFWISENLGFEVFLSNIVAALILSFGVFSFSRQTLNPWIAIIAATPYLIIVFGMSGIRQAMGVGVFLYVLSQWQKRNAIFRSVGIIIASLFHTSALFCGLFVIYTLKINILIRIIAILLLSLIVFYLIKDTSIYSGSFEKYKQTYTEDTDAVFSAGAIYHVGLIMIPAVLGHAFKSKIKKFIPNDDLLTIGIFGTLALLALNSISTTVASRLTLYFYFIPMLVYPAMTLAFGKKNRKFIIIVIILTHFAILTVWMLLGNHSIDYIPYRNLLFETN